MPPLTKHTFSLYAAAQAPYSSMSPSPSVIWQTPLLIHPHNLMKLRFEAFLKHYSEFTALKHMFHRINHDIDSTIDLFVGARIRNLAQHIYVSILD